MGQCLREPQVISRSPEGSRELLGLLLPFFDIPILKKAAFV